ncbi:MAG: Inosine/xanthosine triphosphatase [Sodalis sp.]|nr:MAG: Inosine/xanthosine triphosphatase [Sodalis sp.]
MVIENAHLRSASLMLPSSILQGITEGRELGYEMARLTGIVDIKHRGGDICVFTEGRLTRSSVCQQTLFLALVLSMTRLSRTSPTVQLDWCIQQLLHQPAFQLRRHRLQAIRSQVVIVIPVPSPFFSSRWLASPRPAQGLNNADTHRQRLAFVERKHQLQYVQFIGIGLAQQAGAGNSSKTHA